MGRLFGTDGARGIAVTELTCELAMQLGRAAAHVLKIETKRRPKILIGKDTRNSSDILEAAMCAGICSVGADVERIGIVPTPAAARLVKEHGCDAGIMISASRNSAEFNGIKMFSAEGCMFSEEMEEDIEALILEYPEHIHPVCGRELGRITICETAAEEYIKYAAGRIQNSLEGLRIAVDCANGSASLTAETLFTRLGAEVLPIHAKPDGMNINAVCGAAHIEDLMDFVKNNHCDAGLAFDGDASRCLAVDETGEMIDGDKLLAIFADAYRTQGRLKRNALVVTVMSNLGFAYFAKQHDIRPVIANAGERYVLEKMMEGGYNLGGEQSGNIIFLDESAVSDGQLNGARLLELLKISGKKMSELASVMEKFPQVMVNIRIPCEKKENWKNDDVITTLIDTREQELGDAGRIVVRESSTDAMIRVMIEGRDFKQINAMAMEISDTIRERVGR